MLISLKNGLSFVIISVFVQCSLFAQDCPSTLIVTPVSYVCNITAQTYDVVFTIKAPVAVSDPWVGSTVLADFGNLAPDCQSTESPGNPNCNYVDPPVWNWVCACDGKTHEEAGYPDFVGCTGMTIVSAAPCDGTYPVSYHLTDVPFGFDVTLTVFVNLAISLPDLYYPTCEYNLNLPAPATPIQPGSINGPNASSPSATTTYNITNIPGATGYQWTVPNGSSITSGQGTNTIEVQWGSSAGDVCVSSTTTCATSPPTCLSVDFLTSSISITNVITNGLTGSFQVSGGTPLMDGSNYTAVTMSLQGNPGVTATLTGSPFTHNDIVNFTAPQAGTYDVWVTDGSGNIGSGNIVLNGGGGGNLMDVAPCIEWQRCLGGSMDFDFGTAIRPVLDGGFILSGITMSNDGDVSGNHGSQDCWVVKLSPSGVLEWQKALGGSSPDAASDIQVTADGGFLIAGNASSNDGDVTGNHGVNDFWVVKLNAIGNLIWQKSFGGISYDEGIDIELTLDGGFIMSGNTSSNDGDVTGNHGNFDFWIIKVDALGKIVWQKTLGGSVFDDLRSLESTPDGGFIVAGSTKSNDGDVSGNHGESDIWVVKMDSLGSIIWQKTFGGSNDDMGYSIQPTLDNGFILTGNTLSNDGDVIDNNGATDTWVVKLDALGNLIWQKTFGGSDDDEAFSIQLTSDGGFIIAGSSSSLDGDLLGIQSHGESDVWVFKLGNSGNLIWQSRFGGSGHESAADIQMTLDGDIILVGSTTSNDGDVSGNHGGFNDIWAVKLQMPSLPSSCPTLLTPFPNSTNIPIVTALKWTKAESCLDGYRLSLGTTPGGVDLLNNQTVTDTFYQPTASLPIGTTIYVRIIPFNNLGDATSCQEFSFTTAAPIICDVVRDSLALVALYSSTGGMNWTHQDNWLIPGKSIGDWYGVITNNQGCAWCIDMEGMEDCFSVGGNGTGNNLVGTLPAEIGNLSNLAALMLPFNQLSGNIPPEIGNLSSLTNLYLFYNQLSGEIPSEMSNLSNLIDLQLYHNQLSGEIPISLSNLKQLRAMLFYNNQLSGHIPDFDLPNLDKLWLAGNLLDGTIPNFHLPGLKSLGLDQNHLQGIVPDFSGTAVEGLGVFKNRLTFSGMLYHTARFYPAGFSYEPQDSIFSDTLFIRAPGDTLTINLGIDANVIGNQYQWYKGANIDGLPLTSNQRTFTGLSISDAGDYYVQVTNPAAPDLTLFSRAIHIQVGCIGIPMPSISGPNALCGTSAVLSVSGNYPTPPVWSNGQTGSAITINSAGNYTVTVTDINGCSNSNTLMVSNIQQPFPPIISGPDALCSGTAILNVSGNYISPPQWSTGQTGNSITINTPGIYSITVTDVGGCSNANTKMVDAFSVPSSPTIFGPSTICDGAVASLFIAGNYLSPPQWSNGQLGLFTVVNSSGIYAVTVTDAGGCVNTSTHEVVLKSAVFAQKDSILCPGESLTYCGVTYTQADTIQCMFTTPDGCDSTLTLQVSWFNPNQFMAVADTVLLSAQLTAGEFSVIDNDIHANNYVLKILKDPTQGIATVLNNQELRYTPNNSIQGPDSLQYGLCPPGNCPDLCATAWVLIKKQAGSLDDTKALIPNIITPDGDGINDVFDPIQVLTDNGFLVEKADLFIVNRWGEVVYHSSEGQWDGKVNHKTVPQATYYYRLRFEAGGQYELKGALNLLR